MTGREEQVDAIEGVSQSAGHVRNAEKRRDRLLAGRRARPLDGTPERIRSEAARGSHRARRTSRVSFTELFSKPVAESGYNKPAAEARDALSPSPMRRSVTSAMATISIAAITSCTNTSNPWRDAGCRHAGEEGGRARIEPQAGVKTSLAPGSRVVTEYLGSQAYLQRYLDQLGFHAGRLRLHDVHRARGRSTPASKDIVNDTSDRRRASCRAIAISKRACTRPSKRNFS